MLQKKQAPPLPSAAPITIPVYKPAFWGNEKKYVNECLDTLWISSRGHFVEAFERSFAAYTGAPHAIAACNGTVVLHLAMLALGIGAGDEVIVPTLTYIASTNAIAYVNATPVFVDSLPDSWQIDPAAIRAAITPRTKAIMAVDLYGLPCDMFAIRAIADEYNLKIVQDSAEAFGSRLGKHHVGDLADISTYSFFGNKTITTGEGGMVTCKDSELNRRMRVFRNQGNAENREYWHDVIGYNYRMTNICAALGLAQLEKADEILSHKRQVAAWYREGLKGLPLRFHDPIGDMQHSYWMCSIALDDAKLRDPLRQFLRAQGIETRPVFFPNHSLPMYQHLAHGDYPVANAISAAALNLPSFPTLTQDEVEQVCAAIQEFLS
jgi:perosamine synthetase